MFCRNVCMCTALVPGACGGQKQAPDPRGWMDGCALPCGCWELNVSPLQEQPVLLTSEEASLQSCILFWNEFLYLSIRRFVVRCSEAISPQVETIKIAVDIPRVPLWRKGNCSPWEPLLYMKWHLIFIFWWVQFVCYLLLFTSVPHRLTLCLISATFQFC